VSVSELGSMPSRFTIRLMFFGYRLFGDRHVPGDGVSGVALSDEAQQRYLATGQADSRKGSFRLAVGFLVAVVRASAIMRVEVTCWVMM
jgi:hypothetical protein